jgi:hypothetical protein
MILAPAPLQGEPAIRRDDAVVSEGHPQMNGRWAQIWKLGEEWKYLTNRCLV